VDRPTGDAMTDTDESTGTTPPTTKTVSFGAGCFWQVEAAFRELEGVVDTAVGYEGGTVENPTYEQVCTGTTGHAEVCRVTYDPGRISFGELLRTYWGVHDPTQVDRQGPDVGSQYRSVIFFSDEEQRAEAEASKQAEQQRHPRPIATTIEPATGFYMAEDYHQCYLEKRGSGGLIGTLLGR
jgi:peptide-methionine (S)-S-oxide reductase